MDATFENSGVNTETVENCLTHCSQIFPFFAAKVIDKYRNENQPYEHNDPLMVGRESIKELYEIVGLEMPGWWCPKKFEDCVDSNAYQWFDILNKGIFKIKRKLDSLIIEIEEGTHDIKERLKSFPTHLHARKAGLGIEIGNADAFVKWLNDVKILYIQDKGKPTRRMRKLLNKGR